MVSDVVALERIEREAWRQLAEAAPPAFAQGIGLECRPIGSAMFLMASRVQAFQFNFLAGAGLESAELGARRAGGRAISPKRGSRSSSSRFRPARMLPQWRREPGARVSRSIRSPGRNSYVRRMSRPPADASGRIREVGPDEADLFAATAVAGFGMPPPMSAWLREIVGKTGWRCFAGFLDGAPVGAGALFVQGDYAWLGVGATRPEARKRGLHSALLARRIEAAHRAGARYVVTETGVPQAGQPAPSYNNILAAGFKVAYVRPNWAPSGSSSG